jgi:hypothetical protein
MTKEEYTEKVHDTATAILTECDAKEWKQENEDEDFWKFEDEKNYDGQILSILDAICDLGSWKEAVDILQVTGQDPDQVDSGLYEGCGWERILIRIAFEVFQWDVMEEAGRLFKEDDFEEAVLKYPDTPHQRGFFPETKKFKVPDGPWVVRMHDAVKIYVGGRFAGNKEASLSVVFEGSVEKRGVKSIRYVVDCRRVYNQTETDIAADLTRCKEEFGVREC